MGPQTRILFSLSGNLESNSPQQIVQVFSDPLVEAVESTSLLLSEFAIVPKRPEYSGSQRSIDPVEEREEDEAYMEYPLPASRYRRK
jgi:hypothetical protein